MKKFLPAFILLIVALGLCVIGDAASVPPWWMIGQSATENGAASFTVPISTTGSMTSASVDTGPATFSGNIGGSAAAFMVNAKSTDTGSLIGVLGRRYVSLGSNMKYDSGYKKISNSSPSAYLQIDCENPYPMFYRSDAGSSNAFQYGPYTVWHSGSVAFIGAGPCTLGVNTTDGSDNSYTAITGGAAAGSSRGGAVYAYGNEHATLPGYIDLSAGTIAGGGSIRLITGGSARVTIQSGGVASFSENAYFAKDVSALTFTDRSDSPETIEEAYEVVTSHQPLVGEGVVDHTYLSPLAWGKGEDGTPDQSKRNMSMVISAQSMVIKDLLKRIKKLESEE